jgi:hypothetical protein
MTPLAYRMRDAAHDLNARIVAGLMVGLDAATTEDMLALASTIGEWASEAEAIGSHPLVTSRAPQPAQSDPREICASLMAWARDPVSRFVAGLAINTTMRSDGLLVIADTLRADARDEALRGNNFNANTRTILADLVASLAPHRPAP